MWSMTMTRSSPRPWFRRTLIASAMLAAGALTLGGSAAPAKAQANPYCYAPYYNPTYCQYYSYYYPYAYPYYGYGYPYAYPAVGIGVGWGWGWRGGWGWHGGWGGGWHR
jgi:hypothetical protein